VQIVLIGVPYRAGTLLILGADTFTEKVASRLMIGMLRDVRAEAMELAQTD